MACSCLGSFHVAIQKQESFAFNISSSSSSSLVMNKKKNSILVHFHNNGNMTSADGFSSLLPERLATKVNEKSQVILSPNVKKNQEEIRRTNPNSTKEDFNGVGVVRFLKGKSLFITGATGFLGKVLIEKILRKIPDVGKIYVLIKARNNEAAVDRLKSEIVNTELFSSLRETHGKNYQDFMLRKLTPVLGDVRKAQIGIEADLADKIFEEADVIVHSAANTTFDERYDVALDINTIGPFRLMSFAKRFKRLKLFLQVSTAYVNGQRQGRVLEKPFHYGDTIARETISEFSKKPMQFLDIETEIKLAFGSLEAVSSASLIHEMKVLGLARAKMHGWQDTYMFTKAMGEMVINSMRGDVPVVTIRPSAIESTFKDPFPGWIEGNKVMDPIVLSYGKGHLTAILADPNVVYDLIGRKGEWNGIRIIQKNCTCTNHTDLFPDTISISPLTLWWTKGGNFVEVPVDMVVNALLVAMAKHGQCSEPGIHIYHIASSVANPLVFQDLFWFCYEHFSASPWIDLEGKAIIVPPMKIFTDINEFSTYIWNEAGQKVARGTSDNELSQRQKKSIMKIVEKKNSLANLFEPYTFYGGRFDNSNTRKLMEDMSEEEVSSFGFDVGGIDWGDYIRNIHIPGFRKYVMKEKGIHSNS